MTPRDNTIPFRRPPKTPPRTWLAGMRSLPIQILEEGPSAAAPVAVLWMDLESGQILSQAMGDGRSVADSIRESWRDATAGRFEGVPGSPDCIRVADSLFAAAVSQAIEGDIPVEVGPVPELDAAFDGLDRYLNSDNEPIPPGQIVSFFEAANGFHRAAPWHYFEGEELIRIDAPEIQVEGAALSIMGPASGHVGLLILPSVDFVRRRSTDPPIAIVSFAARETLDPQNVELIARLGLNESMNPDAIPLLTGFDSNGQPCDPTGSDFRNVAGMLRTLVAFVAESGEELREDPAGEVMVELGDRSIGSVRFTFPADSHDDLKEEFEASRPPQDRELAADLRLVRQLTEYAYDRFDSEWTRHERDFLGSPHEADFSTPWSVYGFPVQGRSVLDWYCEEHSDRLSEEQLERARAQRASRVSIWKVTGTTRGKSVTLDDCLTQEVREVTDATASKSLRLGDCVLARVAEVSGEYRFFGFYPFALKGKDVGRIVERVEKRLRRKVPIPEERMQNKGIERYLLRRWVEAAQ